MGHAVVIGGGPNGLAAAIVLASKGRQVTVYEARDEVGGRCHLLGDTSCVQDWALNALKLRLERTPGSTLHQATTGEVKQIDDAVPGVRNWRNEVARFAPLVNVLSSSPAPDIREQASLFSLVTPAMSALKLGRSGALELARIGPLCAEDWLDEWGIPRWAQAAICAPALNGTWMGPRSPTSALALLFYSALQTRPLSGGMGTLLNALSERAKAVGVNVETSTKVSEIKVVDDAVTGVVLEGGQTVDADVVLSTVDPKTTLLDLVDPKSLPFGLEAAVQPLRCRGIVAVMKCDLAEPIFGGAPHVVVTDDNVSLEKAFDDAKHRRLPVCPSLDVYQAEGQARILVFGAAIDLDQGWTDEAKATLEARVMTALKPYADSDVLTRTDLWSPKELCSEFGLNGGHLFHGEFALDQFLSFRPHPSLCRYQTGVAGLILGGAGSHPAGAFTLGQGVLAAQSV